MAEHNDWPNCTMRCGPAWSARAAPARSRSSTSTPCSTSPPRREVDGVKFDGVDLFLIDPHISIDISDDDLKTPRRQDRGQRARRRLAGCAGLARRRRLGDGRAKSSARISSRSARPAVSASG